MADQKITELTELIALDAADVLAIVDLTAPAETKKITVANLTSLVGAGSLAGLTDTDLTGQVQGDLLFNVDGTEWQDTGGLLQWDGAQLSINDYAFPAADGAADQVLTTDGLGNLTFESPGVGGDVSKVGTPVNNQVAVWTGDGTIEGDALLTWDGSQLLLPSESDSLTPTLGFGDGDTGFYEVGDDSLRVAVDGVATFQFWSANRLLSGAGSSSGYLRNTAATTTVPVMGPYRSDLDTGIGRGDADTMSFICGGVEIMRLVEASTDYVHFNTPLLIAERAAAIANQAGFGQLWVNSADDSLNYTTEVGVNFDLTAGGGGGAPTGTVDGQLQLWDQATDQAWEGSIQLSITESNTGGGIINFFGNALTTPVEFLRWTSTDGGVVSILEPILRLDDGKRIDLWAPANAARSFIRGIAGPWFEFSAESPAALTNTGAIFQYPVSIHAQIAAPTTIIGDANRLWSYQFNAGANPVMLTQNSEDAISMPIGAPSDANWAYTTNHSASDPGLNLMRHNTGNFSSVTEMYFDDIDITETDKHWWFSKLAIGDILQCTQGSDTGRWADFEVTSITDNSGWWTVGVTHLDSAGTTFINADDCRIAVLRASILSSGTGDVSKVGTPVDNQVGVWTGNGTIEGTSSLIFDSVTDILSIDSKEAIDGADSFLRLNDNGDFTGGVFVGGNVGLRVDGPLQVRDTAGADTMTFTGTAVNMNWAFAGMADLNLTGLTGDFVMQDIGLVGPVLQDYGIKSQSEVVAANAFTVTYTEGPTFEVDLEAATAAVIGTISGGPVSGDHGQVTIKVQQDGTAARLLTWAGGTFRWAGGTAHPVTTTLDGFSLYTFETWDGGATWYAAGADYS